MLKSSVIQLLFATFVCLATSKWTPGHLRSDHHVRNPPVQTIIVSRLAGKTHNIPKIGVKL